MMPLGTMTSLFLAACFQQALLKDVRLASMPLEKAIDQIAKLYNSPMTLSTLLKGQIVLIDASQVSESELRDQLAKTLNATWEKKDGFWHLAKTTQDQKEDAIKAAWMRTRFLLKTLELRKKAAGTTTPFTREFSTQTYNQLLNQAKNADPNQMQPPGPTAAGFATPPQRLMSRFLDRFGADKILKVLPGERAVFSIKPNAMQSKLDIDLQAELTTLRKEEDIWLKAVEDVSKNDESRAKTTTSGETPPKIVLRSGDEQSEIGSSLSRSPNELSNALFTVFCSTDGVYKMALKLSSNNPDEPFFEVEATSFEGAFADMTAEDFQMKEHPDFKLSQDASDFQNFFMGKKDAIPAERRKAMLDRFADTVSNDPLSYGLTECTIYDARRFKKNIIAVCRDQNLNVFDPFFGDSFFEGKHSELDQEFVEREGNWIRMPQAPNDEPNFPRLDLKRIIANVRRNGRVNIQDRAEIAAIRPRTNAVSYVERILEKFVDTAYEEYGEVDALKVFGLLTESEKVAAFRPQGIPFSQLGAKLQRHLFECAFYNEYQRISPVDFKVRIPNFVAREPTLLAPNGITNAAVFKIEEKRESMIKDSNEGNSIGLMANAKAWGQTKYQVEHPEDYPGNNFKFDFSRKLRRLEQVTYSFTLLLNPNCQWTSNLQNINEGSGQTFTLANLPDDLKADFDAGYKEATEWARKRKELEKKKGGGGGTTLQIRM